MSAEGAEGFYCSPNCWEEGIAIRSENLHTGLVSEAEPPILHTAIFLKSQMLCCLPALHQNSAKGT